MRHPHADLIVAWAEGAEIEWYDGDHGAWFLVPQPSWNPNQPYRVKPKKPDWHESIPEHGVLCWVSNKVDTGPDLMAIHKYDKDEKRFYAKSLLSWAYATPLTNEEIRRFYQ